jgi:hypothetical protein
MNSSFNKETGQWEEAIPLPFYYGLLPFLWLRLTRYRDSYGRKATFIGFKEQE